MMKKHKAPSMLIFIFFSFTVYLANNEVLQLDSNFNDNMTQRK